MLKQILPQAGRRAVYFSVFWECLLLCSEHHECNKGGIVLRQDGPRKTLLLDFTTWKFPFRTTCSVCAGEEGWSRLRGHSPRWCVFQLGHINTISYYICKLMLPRRSLLCSISKAGATVPSNKWTMCTFMNVDMSGAHVLNESGWSTDHIPFRECIKPSHLLLILKTQRAELGLVVMQVRISQGHSQFLTYTSIHLELRNFYL